MCARSRESTCPDVSQLCSTTKQYLIQSNGKNLPAPPLPPSLPLSLVLSFHPHQKLLITRQRSVIKTHVYTRVSFMDQDLERGKKQTHERSVNHVEQRATVVCFLSPFLELNTVHIWRRPKMSNNAAIQHVISLLLNRKSVIWRHFENRSDKSSPLQMVRIFLIWTSCQDRSVYAWGGNGEAHRLAVGSKKYQQISTEAWVTGSCVVLDKLNTHQETGMLVFPLVTMQFFSSGLIMVG